MAGKIIIDTIDTDNAFITLNVQQSLIATMNVSGIYSNTGVKMIGANGTISNTAITGLVTAAQIATVANTQITGNITSSQITSNPTFYGNVSVTGAIGVGGATPTSNGSGITFPATQSASSDANTLDDYEEGTFTPTVIGTTTAGTATYTSPIGRYTKIGNRVLFSVELLWNSGNGTGNLRITGLPFTSNATGNPVPAIGIGDIALTASNVAFAYVLNNATTLVMRQSPVGGGGASSVAYDVAGEITLTGHYEV